MKDKNQIISNEELYKQYIELYHSSTVRLMRNVKRINRASIKNKYRLIKKKLITKLGDRKIAKKVRMINKHETYYNFGEPMENIKIAVYSCITNGYDFVEQPVYIGNDTTYHVFTDEINGNTGLWNEHSLSCGEYVHEANRYYKFHPFQFFKDYDFAIYIDGNVKVLSDVSTICSIASKSKVGIAMHRHHCRDCVYQEALACKYYKRGNRKKIFEQIAKFRKEGFTEKFGLCEATIIVYDLKNPLAKKIAQQWWEEYYRSGTKRDQISFPYVIWKNGLEINDVGDLGNNLMENPKFLVRGHISNSERQSEDIK